MKKKKVENASVSKKIRKGDKVIAIAGNYKGQSGTVLSRRGDRIVVQGLNVRKKHVKRTQEMPNGNILELEQAIHVSNLRVCTEDDKKVTLKVKTTQNGERQFYYREGNDEVVYRSLKKHNP